MKISTKVECGIIAIMDIALNSENGNVVKVASISKRNNCYRM
jgi:DNA-binding IscR family transcriptional regulator